MVRHDVNQETGNPRALTEALRLIRERSTLAVDAFEDSVLVLAAAEADGICAAHILTSILRLEGVAYTLQSIDTYSELETVLKTLRASVRTVVLLNCGAVVDLTTHELGDVVLIVIDSHRPIHHRNVKEPARILVLDDDLGRGGYFPLEAMEDEPDAGSDLIEDILFSDDEDEDQPNKRPRLAGAAERKKILREYYEGFYYASPSSLVLYALAADMGYATQQLLWLACVGLASYVESGHFSLHLFHTIAQDVENHYLNQGIENQGDAANTSGGGGSTGLKFHEDLRLTMYRHWSLFEAMCHTPYVYSKLELHRDHGHGTMQKLLVFAGLAPTNYRQNFSSMSHSARQLVRSEKFKKKCALFGLDEIKAYTFVRTVRMQDLDRPSLMLNELTASDMYFMIATAVRTRGFNFAMDVAANAAPLTEMHEAITKALDVHKDVVSQARLILDMRAWRMVDGFRFSVIENPISPVFQESPPAIRWLALFLMTVLQQRNRAAGAVPLLLCVKNGASYVCLGCDPQDTKSEFVFRFRNACDSTAVKIQLNSFDFALAHVPSADFETWSRALLGADMEAVDDDLSDEEDDALAEEEDGLDEDGVDDGIEAGGEED